MGHFRYGFVFALSPNSIKRVLRSAIQLISHLPPLNPARCLSNSFLTPIELAMSSSFKSVVDIQLRKTPAQHGPIRGQSIHPISNVGEISVSAGIPTLSDKGTVGSSSLQRMLHDQRVQGSKLVDQAASPSAAIQHQLKNLPSPHHSVTADGIPGTLDAFFTSGLYGRSTHVTRACRLLAQFSSRNII